MAMARHRLTLNRAVTNTAHLAEPQRDPAVGEQVITNALRMSQTRKDIVTRYVVKNTLEKGTFSCSLSSDDHRLYSTLYKSIINLQRETKKPTKFTLDAGVTCLASSSLIAMKHSHRHMGTLLETPTLSAPCINLHRKGVGMRSPVGFYNAPKR